LDSVGNPRDSTWIFKMGPSSYVDRGYLLIVISYSQIIKVEKSRTPALPVIVNNL
jgi:hypothetical protein